MPSDDLDPRVRIELEHLALTSARSLPYASAAIHDLLETRGAGESTRVSAMRRARRDERLRRLAALIAPEGASIAARAEQVARLIDRYRSTGWQRDRTQTAPPAWRPLELQIAFEMLLEADRAVSKRTVERVLATP